MAVLVACAAKRAKKAIMAEKLTDGRGQYEAAEQRFWRRANLLFAAAIKESASTALPVCRQERPYFSGKHLPSGQLHMA